MEKTAKKTKNSKNILKNANFWQEIGTVFVFIGFILAIVGVAINGGKGETSDDLAIVSLVLVVVGVACNFVYIEFKAKEGSKLSKISKENVALKEQNAKLEAELADKKTKTTKNSTKTAKKDENSDKN